jgi:glucose-6-phosphate isomerase, archaeal
MLAMSTPFAYTLDSIQERIEGLTPTSRRLSSLRGQFLDSRAFDAQLAQGNPVLYEYYPVHRPEVAGELFSGLTTLYPGTVGGEYFMTKGHFHALLETGEIYYCLSGQGKLVMETPEGTWQVTDMSPGVVVYIPPRWAHRTVNTGPNKFSFFWVCPADAGHDYGSIERQGFRKRVVEQNGSPTLIDNPHWLPPAQRV